MTPSLASMTNHICHGTTFSCYISLTRSYGVAEEYAYSGTMKPTPISPGHVYEIDIPDPSPTGIGVIDPISLISSANSNPLSHHSYYHDGDQSFLLGVVDPIRFRAQLAQIVKTPPGSGATPRSANLTHDLEAIVRAARDSEVLVTGNIPSTLFVNRYNVY